MEIFSTYCPIEKDDNVNLVIDRIVSLQVLFTFYFLITPKNTSIL